MINILYLIDHIWNWNGGTEGQLLMLIRGLDPEKYRTHLFCLKETPWSKTARVDFPLRVLHIHKLLGPGILPKIVAFREYCRRNKIDIIQTYFNDALIFGVLAGRFAGVKRIIASRRNLGPGFWKKRGQLFAFRALKGMITGYMANSLATRESVAYYEGVDPQKIEIIYNGLDLRRFDVVDEAVRRETRDKLGLSESNVLIGMVAHLRREKNISLFLKAAHIISRGYPEARFVILGEGGERANLEAEIMSLGIEKTVTLTGSVMDVVPYLAAMDIACLTSDGESFSNSIIEYQAAGLPVVATSVGGNCEAIPSKDLLFAPNDLDGFVKILSRLASSVEMRRRIGQENRQLAYRRYSVATMISQHEEMYRKCMSES
jgi:glycosyltransferase involved in cell wall biosynthesis